MNEPEVPKKKGWGCLPWGVVMGVLTLLACLFLAGYGVISVKADQMKAASNLRSIVGLLFVYAADHDGQYPDEGRDLADLKSNEAFRLLFEEDLIHDETIFGCPGSHFNPDKNIGDAPSYDQAVKAGENHWMMVARMTNVSPDHFPLVMENAVDDAWPPRWKKPSWQPVWLARLLRTQRGKGVAWKNNTIIVAFNDGSGQTLKLERKGDDLHLPQSVLEPEGKTPLPIMKLLEIEEAGTGSYSSP